MNGFQSLTANLLASAGVFTDERIQEIVTKRAENPGMGLMEAVVKFGGVKEGAFLLALGKSLELEVVDLSIQKPSSEALAAVQASAVYQYHVLPYIIDSTSLTVVMSDPFNRAAVDGLRLVVNRAIRVALAPAEDIEKALKKYYGLGADAIEKMGVTLSMTMLGRSPRLM